jgi:LmbE family N-acetylglucosaminyl deacetylase
MSDTVAVVAAHADDEVLGCGGTIARLAKEGRAVHILLLADGETSRELTQAAGSAAVSARKAAASAACVTMGAQSVELLELPDNRLDGIPLLEVVKRIEAFVARYEPSQLFTHHYGDVNIDHKVVHDAVLAACRPQPGYCVRELLFFEVPSSTEWRTPGSLTAFQPNWFFDISATLQTKLDALRAYEHELREFPHPRSYRAVEALAHWRGATIGVAAAEAFVLGRKLS